MPQAVRRVIPPLLNDFIGLQKDTALLSIAGISEAFQVADLLAVVPLHHVPGRSCPRSCSSSITIPQARFVDYLIDRDAKRRAGG